MLEILFNMYVVLIKISFIGNGSLIFREDYVCSVYDFYT